MLDGDDTMTDLPTGNPPLRPHGRDLESTVERVELLEEQVRSLGRAIRALVQGLENLPDDEPDPERAARAARVAHELLLSMNL
ncbi:hypothetical protein [Kitasatospora sp. NPDC093679]|uniref:hypothetical protein n=1 Tax=Kitasatospora sp. NPDC093679 TaxID=3154983 RepID=UPI003427BF55